MTLADVMAHAAAIADVADDNERAHVFEDELHRRVLQAIADGTCEDPQGCAREAIRTLELRFKRWYA